MTLWQRKNGLYTAADKSLVRRVAAVTDFPTVRDFSPNRYNGRAKSMPRSTLQLEAPGSQALVFDGISQYVDMGDILGPLINRLTSFSVSYWFKTTSTNIVCVISRQKENVLPSGWGTQINQTTINFYLCHTFPTNILQVYCTNSALNDNQWHHCVITYDGSVAPTGFHIYVDNSNRPIGIDYNNLTSDIYIAGKPLRIGERDIPASRLLFDGSIADVAIWDKELSPVEASEIYNNTVPVELTSVSCAANLAAWWRCGDAFNLNLNGVRDFSGNGLHGTQSAMLVSNVESRANIGKSLQFNGTDQYVIMGDVLDSIADRLTPFSISCWAKTGVTTAAVVIARQTDDGSPSGWDLEIDGSYVTCNLIHTYITNCIAVYSTPAQSLNDENWHHYTVTYSGSGTAVGFLFYIDGLVKVTAAVYDNLVSDINSLEIDFTLARREIASSRLYFEGFLDEISIWDKELSAAEVEAIYHSAIPTDLSGSANLVGYWRIG